MKIFICFLFILTLFSQDKILYNVSFKDKEHRQTKIRIEAKNLKEKIIEFRFSRSSPGRYAIHEFAKNVFDVHFYDSDENELKYSKPNTDQWNVSGHDGTIIAEYTLFADRADGTYSQVNSEHAHFNAPATFMFLRQYKDREIIVDFDLKKTKWKVATQLEKIGKNRYMAPNHYYLMDSPIELSNHDLLSWNHAGQKIEMAIHHDTNDDIVKPFFEMAKYIVLEQEAVFGELAKFDYKRYTFIADYLSYASRDGMEHRNSTILSSNRSLDGNQASLLGTVSHEFFHTWNVERLRPKSLEPFDFENANMSGELWLAEGFTSYYDGLTIHRAGLSSIEDLCNDFSGTLNYVLLSPGSSFHSPKEMSYRAPFVDAATSIDPHYTSNTFISYYSYGAAIALGLDLTLRSQFNNLTLDGFMRKLWEKYGKTEITYTIDDVEKVLADYTNKDFASKFFQNHIHGKKYMDYKKLFNRFGLNLDLKDKNKPWIGSLSFEKDKLKMRYYTRMNQPLYKAGLDRGDEILELNKKVISNKEDLEKILEGLKIGKKYQIKFKRLNKEVVSEILIEKNPRLSLKPSEFLGKKPTKKALDLRKEWLKSHATKTLTTLHKVCPDCERSYKPDSKYCSYDAKELKLELAKN